MHIYYGDLVVIRFKQSGIMFASGYLESIEKMNTPIGGGGYFLYLYNKRNDLIKVKCFSKDVLEVHIPINTSDL